MPPDPAGDARRWFLKDQDDLRAGDLDLEGSPPLVEDALCHAQQAAEKARRSNPRPARGHRRSPDDPALEQNRAAVADLCHRYHVARLDVFGTAATDAFDPQTSDLDFLVEFRRAAEMNLADQYFGLWDGLRTLLAREVDLLTPRSLRNPYLIEAVERSRQVLYAA